MSEKLKKAIRTGILAAGAKKNRCTRGELLALAVYLFFLATPGCSGRYETGYAGTCEV